MNRFYRMVLAISLLFVLCQGAGFAADPALHPFFAQNGDCYMLIGTGPYRGVYAMNNLTSGINKRLYDPFEAYGLTAAQSYDVMTIQKWLYTFASTETGWQAFTGLAERRVVMNATWNTYAANVVPPFTVHRYHGSPFNSPTGRGNHPQGTLNYKFSGFDYPCSQIPANVPGRPGYQYVQMGKFYHSLDRPVKSPYAYGGYYGPGYWVHWAVRENSLVKYRNLKLYEFNVTANTGPTPKSDLPKVKIEEKLTLDKRGECIDGCISASDGEVLPGGMTPYLDTAYASTIKKSYLYSREPNKTEYTLYGYLAGKDVLIGAPADLSTKFIGISSSKFAGGSYLYCLGKNIINKWMTDAAAPAGMLVNEIEDLAVSDQWWLTGGIVYVYDKTKRKVYKFVRNEGSKPGIPEEISVDDGGIAPDSIGSDGFGHLYMVKTQYVPAKADDFLPKDAYLIEPNTMWPNRYRAYFKQYVYKTIYKRDYYTKAIKPVPGKITLGSNQFYRDFMTTTLGDTSTWLWAPNYVQFGPVVQTEYRTELAVINSATPPEVTNTTAICDAVGPMTIFGINVVYENKPLYNEDEFYVFDVENSPDFDVNGVNTGNDFDDVDKDKNIGCFPSTTHEPSLLYYWKITQLKDRFGNEVNNEILNQEKDGTPGDYRLVRSFPGGDYKVAVRTRYRYYDYSKLKPGDMADKKDTVLTGYFDAQTEDPSSNYSIATFTVEYHPPPPDPKGEGVVMTGKPTSATTYTYRPTSEDAATIPILYSWIDPTPDAPKHPKYVLIEGCSNWSFKIRDSLTNINAGTDRVAQMNLAVPPHPNPSDPKIIPGSIKWISDAPSYSWTADIKWLNGEGMNVRVETNKEFITIDEIAKLFRVPSQPEAYKLTVKGSRAYEYRQFTFDFVKNEWKDVSVPKVISIEAIAYIIVTDETGPATKFANPFYDPDSPKPGVTANSNAFFCSAPALYGTTGEALTNTAGKTNVPLVEFVVADNNPNAQASTASYTDQFFSTNKMVHNTDLMFARYHYQVATVDDKGVITNGKVPIGDGTIANPHKSWYHYKSLPFSNPTDLDKARCKLKAISLSKDDFNKITWITSASSQYNPSFSYRKYSMKISDIIDFSCDSDGNYYPGMATGYANNISGYSNLDYGLFWQEPCNKRWISSDFCKGGELVIIDNDRPNVFVKLIDLKYDGDEYVGPGRFKPDAWGKWHNLFDDVTNGAELLNGTIPSVVKDYKYDDADTVKTVFFKTGVNATSSLEVDVPAFFTLMTSDNTAALSINEFSISKKGALSGKEEFFITGSEQKHLFREPGEYVVRAVIEDSALGWPKDYTKPVATALSARNKRELVLRLDVLDTRLDVRILERDREGK
ncbi:MAG: hypothetical protein KKB51_15245 [Candidatus Riflebacteria bacterium]|nr:hypothetical protein [Candidatus Riflebacteria bacterium]